RPPERLELPAAVGFRQLRADTHVDLDVLAAASLEEMVAAGKGGERLVALDDNLDVGETHVQVLRLLEVLLQRRPLSVAQRQVDSPDLLHVPRFESLPVPFEQAADGGLVAVLCPGNRRPPERHPQVAPGRRLRTRTRWRWGFLVEVVHLLDNGSA